uniref:DNA-binding domain-containing protein n=1 Tax=Candidatus Kentrum sp. DK TaxID=2126562 RepID=A0A450T560_9GAMM|nr:MAG: Putative DNA-binding domain-containing protein [Candidatus Kentron sp. DK]
MTELANVRMLVVEDNPRYWKALQEALQEDYGYREIAIAESPEQASERLDADLFDVIIADMRFGDDARGGFSVLREVKDRNITSIVIILTANDNWQDCREAFRGGARDYLSKNMPGVEVFEVLHQSILAALEYAEKYGNRSDERWIAEHREELRRDHPDQHIAVMNNAVIDSDGDKEALLARIRERKLPLLVPIVEYMDMENIAELIQCGEGERLEFKQTFRCDILDGNKKEEMRHATLKSIAAFLNTQGGTLLIGVEDGGAIFGLEMDYASLTRRPDWDGFSQALSGDILQAIGPAFTQFIEIERCPLEGKEIAVVRVERAASPAFVYGRAKKTEPQQKHFYVRTGTTTRSLDVEGTWRYCVDKWK